MVFFGQKEMCFGVNKKNPGQLLGRIKEPLGRAGAPTKAERDKAQDFRNFVGLYCLYGDGDLIYIGEAGLGSKRSLFDRIKSHRKGPMAGRWGDFSWFGTENCEGSAIVKDSLGQLEAIAIAIINPGFNKQSGTFVGATQVYQVPHESAEGDMETKLERMSTMIADLKGSI
jgi:hypothetical protein